MALFWAAVSLYKKLYFHQVGFYLLKKIKVKKENKKALFPWNSIYMTYLCSRLDKPMTPVQAHLDLWLATDKKTTKLASIYSPSSYRFCVCVCVWRCITCLVTLTKPPDHLLSLGLLVVCSGQGAPQLSLCWHGVPAESWGHKGTVQLLLLPVHQPTPLHPTLHHPTPPHPTWSLGTALPEKHGHCNHQKMFATQKVQFSEPQAGQKFVFTHFRGFQVIGLIYIATAC